MPDDNELIPTGATESAKQASGAGREQLDDAGEAIGEFLPKTGKLISALAKGRLIPVAGVIVGIIKEIADEHLAEKNAELDERADVLAKPTGPGIDEYQQQVNDAKLALANLQARLDRAGTDTDPVGTQFNLLKEFVNSSIEATRKLVESRGKFEEERLRSQHATPGQIAGARQRTRRMLDALDKQKRFINGSGLLTLEQAVRQGAQKSLENDAIAAVAHQSQVIAKNKHAQDEIRTLEDQLGTGQHKDKDPTHLSDSKEVNEAQNELEDAFKEKDDAVREANEAGVSDADFYSISTLLDKKIGEAFDKLEEAQRPVDLKTKLLQELKQREETYRQRQADATAAADLTTERVVNNKRRLAELEGKIPNAQENEQIQNDADTQSEVNYAAADQFGLGPSPSDKGQKTQIAPGDISSPGDRSAGPLKTPIILNNNRLTTDDIIEDMSTMNGNQQTLAKVVNNLIKNQQLLAQQVQALTDKCSTLEKQVRELQATGSK